MAKSLKEKKIEMKNDWENCLELKLEDKLTEKGLKKFWDENTSLEEAEAMLTHEAIDDFVGHLFGSLAGAIIMGIGGCQDEEEHDEEPCNIKNGAPYKIARVEDGKVTFIEDDEFETEEAAKAVIQERVNHSTHTLSDFCVIQVQVCK